MSSRATAALFAAAWLAGCELPSYSPDPFVEKLKSNPTDIEAMATLAIIGRPSVAPLLAALEEGASIRKAALTTLSVAGEPCWPAMMDYFDLGKDDEVKLDILEVFAAHRWQGVLRKLSDRVEHPTLGSYVYNTIVRIAGAPSAPPDPWVDGKIDPAKKAEFDRWVGRQASVMSALELRSTLYGRSELEKVKKLIEEEYQRW